LLPCSEAGDAGEAAEVDDHIIDHGEQHATWSTWSAASAATGRVLAASRCTWLSPESKKKLISKIMAEAPIQWKN